MLGLVGAILGVVTGLVAARLMIGFGRWRARLSSSRSRGATVARGGPSASAWRCWRRPDPARLAAGSRSSAPSSTSSRGQAPG